MLTGDTQHLLVLTNKQRSFLLIIAERLIVLVMRVATRYLLGVLALLPVVAFAPETACADEPAYKPWRETWAGADASSNVWLAYSGATVAPFGDVWSDGWRLRAVGGYGQYEVTYGKTRYAARTTSTDLVIGYQKRFGDLTAKLFAGASYVGLDAVAKNGSKRVSEPEIGFKSALELWLDIGDHAFASLDLAGTTAHASFSARVRYGYRISPPLALGPEMILNGNDTWAGADRGHLERALHNDSRFGGFARFQWTGGEASVSGGISGDISRLPRPYGTLNVSLQF